MKKNIKKEYMTNNLNNPIFNKWHSLRNIEFTDENGKKFKINGDHLNLLGVIFGLCWNGGLSPEGNVYFCEACYASNDTLAGFLCVPESTLRKWIYKLHDAKLIEVWYENWTNGTRRWIQPNLSYIDSLCTDVEVKECSRIERKRKEKIRVSKYEHPTCPNVNTQGVQNWTEGCPDVNTNYKSITNNITKTITKNFTSTNFDSQSYVDELGLHALGMSIDEYNSLSELFG